MHHIRDHAKPVVELHSSQLLLYLAPQKCCMGACDSQGSLLLYADVLPEQAFVSLSVPGSSCKLTCEL